MIKICYCFSVLSYFDFSDWLWEWHLDLDFGKGVLQKKTGMLFKRDIPVGYFSLFQLFG